MKKPQQSIHTEPDIDELLERLDRESAQGEHAFLPKGKSRIANHLIRTEARRRGWVPKQQEAAS